MSLSGSFNVFGDDTVQWQAVTGKGVGRYFNDPLSSTGVALGTDRRFDLLRSSGVTLYYQHKWTPDWMTVAGREHALDQRQTASCAAPTSCAVWCTRRRTSCIDSRRR